MTPIFVDCRVVDPKNGGPCACLDGCGACDSCGEWIEESDRPRPRCRSASDGDCFWESCPQLRDREPDKTGRHCPLDRRYDDEEY